MGKPSIGAAVTSAPGKGTKREIKKLEVLKEDSKKSIYYLIFSETENRS